MAKLNTKQSSQTHRIIIYGAPKSGKSLLAGKLAEHYDLIWFDLENGHETLFQLPESWQKRIELIDIPDTRSFPIAIETCLKLVKGAVSICEAHGKCSCLVCKKELEQYKKAKHERADANAEHHFFIGTPQNFILLNFLISLLFYWNSHIFWFIIIFR